MSRLTDFQRAWLLILLGLILTLGLLFLFSPMAHAQTPSQIGVTGHVGDPGNILQGTTLQFQLANCGANQPRVFGYFGYIATVRTFTPDPTTGVVSGSIWPNDVINCGGTTGGTYWNVTFSVGNVPQGPAVCYVLSSTDNPFNLDTAIPCSQLPGPPGPTPPIDVTYHNLTLTGFFAGVAGQFTGQLEVGSLLLDAAPSPCPSGQFTTGLSGTLALTCATPNYPAVPVTSVFGRTAGVVAQSGDYSCAQVTGCQSNAITGLSGAVNASGPGLASSTLSNTGVSAGTYTYPASVTVGVDGRISAIAAGSSTARTCNSNGCYQVDADGTIRAWGVVNAPTNPGTGTTATLTFPVAFTATPTLVVSGGSDASGTSDDAYAVFHKGLTTTGAFVVIRCAVNIGGSGCSNISNSIPVHWIAFGN